MSQRALLLAVQQVLQAPLPNGLDLKDAQCAVLFDGQPPPGCGELFVAVHPAGWQGIDVEGLRESYGVDITVTVRMGVLPRDRQSSVSLLAGAGGLCLDQWLEKIRALLHLDSAGDQVLNIANATIGSQASGFVEPLRFRSGGRPEPKGPDWFSADAETKGRLPPVGLAQTLSFDGAVRVQSVETED